MSRKIASIMSLNVLFIILTIFAAPAIAEYPEKPITMYVAMSAGGSIDSSGRALCNAAEKILGKPFAVTNKPGGGGSVTLGILANEKPDGYTLALVSSTGLIRVPLRRKVPFKPMHDFKFIYCFVSPTSAILVKPDSRFKTLEELVDYAKQNPGKIKYATPGAGTPLHLAMLVIAKKEKLKWIHIPLDGANQVAQAVMGGHVDVGHAAWKYHKSGQLRALASCTQKRMKQFPQIPTMIELGYNYYNDSFFCVFAPAGIGAEKVKILEDAFAQAAHDKKFIQLTDKFMMVRQNMKSAELTKFLEEAWPREEERLKEAGLIKAAATPPR